MSNAPQQQNQSVSSTAGNAPKPDAGKVITAGEKKADNMKDGSCSTTDTKTSDCGTKSSSKA